MEIRPQKSKNSSSEASSISDKLSQPGGKSFEAAAMIDGENLDKDFCLPFSSFISCLEIAKKEKRRMNANRYDVGTHNT